MKVTVQTQGLTDAITSLNGIRPRIQEQWLKTATRYGYFAIEYLVQTFRTYRSAISTGRITGLMARSYKQAAVIEGAGVALRIGALAPSAAVLAYLPVHEFGATYSRRKTHRHYAGRPALDPTAEKVLPLLQEACAQDLVNLVKRAA